MDKKPIYFISSAHDPTDIVTSPRREKNGNLLHVRMPKAVQDYNKFMEGCDLDDQMTRLQRTRKHFHSLAPLKYKKSVVISFVYRIFQFLGCGASIAD